MNFIKTRIKIFKMTLIHKWCKEFGLSPVRLTEVAGSWYIKNNDGSQQRIGRKERNVK